MVNSALAVNNDAVNGDHADISITTHGSDFYWAVCAVMIVSTIVFMGLAVTKPRQDRIFHYITASITLVASIAYFCMASNLGWTSIAVEFSRSAGIVRGARREIFYVRYIDWFITTPLLLMDLMLTAAMPWPTVLFVIIIDEIMIVTGLVGALVSSDYKFGFFTFGCVALLWIVYILVWEARIHAKAVSVDAGKAFLFCGSLTAVIWTLYPIAWGVSEGGNVIAPDSEAVFYGILDMIAKPVFGALLLWGHRNISPASLGLSIHDYGANEPIFHEKHHTNGTSNGVTNGTNGTNGTTHTAGHSAGDTTLTGSGPSETV